VVPNPNSTLLRNAGYKTLRYQKGAVGNVWHPLNRIHVVRRETYINVAVPMSILADSDCGRATVMLVIAGSVLIGDGGQVQKTAATRVVSTRCGNVR